MSGPLILGLALGVGAATLPTVPMPGRYAAELCVATGDTAANCGPAEATVHPRGGVDVQISDIVYQLLPHDGQLDVVLMHGTIQIDGFTTVYGWQGGRLHFSDPDKPVHYRVRIGQAVP